METLYYPQLILQLSVHMPKCRSLCKTAMFGFEGKLVAMKPAACRRVMSGQDALPPMPDSSLHRTVQLVLSGHTWPLPCPAPCLRPATSSVPKPSSALCGKLWRSSPPPCSVFIRMTVTPARKHEAGGPDPQRCLGHPIFTSPRVQGDVKKETSVSM